MSDIKNNKIQKSPQKQHQNELKKAQNQWRKDQGLLEQKKKELGYEHVQLKELLDNAFIESQLAKGVESTTVSVLIELKDDYRNLIERYKQLWPEDYVIKELNKKHAIVHTGQTYVLTEKNHSVFGGKDFSLESRQSFKMYYEDETVTCSNGKKKTKADIWLKSPRRRKYSDIIFDPTISAQSAENKRFYNLWKGFGIGIVHQPDTSNFSTILHHCNGN